MTVLPYSGCAPAKKTVPPAGARTGVRGWALMSRPLWNSVTRVQGETRLPSPEIVALLFHALGETLQLVPPYDSPEGLVPRRDPRGNLHGAGTDALVARAGSELGTERLPDARVELAPSHHLLPELDDAAIERVDRLALLGDLPGEGPGFASQLAQLGPISGEAADHGEGEGDPGERPPRDRSCEVEPDHLGAVAPDNQQTELIAALHACPRPRRLRSGHSSGLRSFPDQTVNRTLLRPHAGRPIANAVPGGMGTHNQAVGAHGLPFRQPSGQFRVTIMTRCIGP